MTDGRKVGPDGAAWLYLVERHDGKELAVHSTRHGAVGQIARCHGGRPEWYSIELVNPLALLTWHPRMTDEFDPYPEAGVRT